MQCVHKSSGWFCALVRRKEVSFIVLRVQIGLIVFSRVSKLMVGIRVSIRIRVSLNVASCAITACNYFSAR